MNWTAITEVAADNSGAIFNVISLVLGAMGGAVGQWIITFWKAKKSQEMSSNDQAVVFYKDLLIKVEAKLDKLEEINNSLEKLYYAEREENFRLKLGQKPNP